MSPTRPGCTTFSTKFLLCPAAVISRPPNPNRSINAAKTRASLPLQTYIKKFYPQTTINQE
jgi:hypothetical protein